MLISHPQSGEDWLSLFRRYTQPLFLSCNRKLLLAWTQRQLKAKQQRYARSPPTTGDENTDNSLQFNFPIGGTPEESFRENYALARAIQVVWKSLVDTQFPESRYTLFVSNEYEVVFDGETDEVLSEEIIPTLRLWTYDPETDEGMRAAYRPDEAGPEKVFWRQRREEGLFDLKEVLRIVGLRKGSTEKTTILKRYFSIDRTRCFQVEE